MSVAAGCGVSIHSTSNDGHSTVPKVPPVPNGYARDVSSELLATVFRITVLLLPM